MSVFPFMLLHTHPRVIHNNPGVGRQQLFKKISGFVDLIDWLIAFM